MPVTAALDEAPLVRGSTTPRVWTPPLIEGPPGGCECGCALTPETSYGWDVIDFARDVLDTPLDPWQRWLVIHAGELLPDGRPRFRTVLAIVARQQGKSLLMRVLILFWMFVEQWPMTLATSTDRSYAKAAWAATCEIAKDNPYLSAELPARPQTLQVGEEEFRNLHGAKYRFAAVNRRAGRSLTINRLVLDEIREHVNFEAWGASTNAMNAVPTAQCLAVSNQGDDTSVVLDDLRNGALSHLENGDGDPRLGLFEWSAPAGSDPCDLRALACSNPNLGNRTDADTLLGAARRAVKAGGEQLTSFLTEVMCIRVDKLDPAFDATAWDECGTDAPIDLAGHRRATALCLDVSLDGSHATLVAAAMVEGLLRLEVVAQWDGQGCTRQLREQLPGIVARVKPYSIGWLPNGPAAAIHGELASRNRERTWPPRRVKTEEIRRDFTAVCMGLSELVSSRQVRHPKDPLLDAHIRGSGKLPRADGWILDRRGVGPIDAAYAAAGAAHLARTMPPPPRPLTAL
jgi:hypothetical protein